MKNRLSEATFRLERENMARDMFERVCLHRPDISEHDWVFINADDNVMLPVPGSKERQTGGFQMLARTKDESLFVFWRFIFDSQHGKGVSLYYLTKEEWETVQTGSISFLNKRA